jgi:hypothetical protein
MTEQEKKQQPETEETVQEKVQQPGTEDERERLQGTQKETGKGKETLQGNVQNIPKPRKRRSIG